MPYQRITPDNLINMRQLADLTGIRYVRLWRAIQRKEIDAPTIQSGGRMFYSPDDIAKLRKQVRELN